MTSGELALTTSLLCVFQLHGSCFLFECGPPSDFRCKFVNHANYTSAILDLMHTVPTTTVPPPPPPPTRPAVVRPILSEHELDLDKLRVKTTRTKGSASDSLKVTATTTSTSTAMPPLGVRIVDVLTTKASQKAPDCTRFQFQCKNGECIAIYDVCNGIPQCTDASDEGPEVRNFTFIELRHFLTFANLSIVSTIRHKTRFTVTT